MKYIVYEAVFEVPVAVIFSDKLVHSEFHIRLDKNNFMPSGYKPVGAGFCYIDNGRMVCKGESESMHLQSRLHKDEFVINRQLGLDK